MTTSRYLTGIRRFAMLSVLLAQLALSLVSVPHLLALPANTTLLGIISLTSRFTPLGAISLNALGVISWGFVILLYKGSSKPIHEIWLQHVALLLFGCLASFVLLIDAAAMTVS